jgi:hypothetical protein
MTNLSFHFESKILKKKNVWFNSLTHEMCKSTIEYVGPHMGFTNLMVEFTKKMFKKIG